jgi:hypothetical protein
MLVTVFFGVVVAAVFFTVLYFVVRTAVVEGMKLHSTWLRQQQTPPVAPTETGT